MLNTLERIELTLRTYTGGYLRYEGDNYAGGNPWVIANLWMAEYCLEAGNKNDRILERESRKVDNVRLNIVMFNLAYPKAIEDVVNTPNDIMEQHYDTSLILEIYDDEEKKLYTFYDLLYSTNKSLDNATIEYNKLHEIIFSSDNAKDLLNSIVELTK